MRSLKLENHRTILASSAKVSDIADAVRTLIEPREAYLILSVDDEDYVQAAGSLLEGFIIERRDGSAGEHYRGDRRITEAELIRMLECYVMGSTDWSHVVSWHRVPFDGDGWVAPLPIS